MQETLIMTSESDVLMKKLYSLSGHFLRYFASSWLEHLLPQKFPSFFVFLVRYLKHSSDFDPFHLSCKIYWFAVIAMSKSLYKITMWFQYLAIFYLSLPFKCTFMLCNPVIYLNSLMDSRCCWLLLIVILLFIKYLWTSYLLVFKLSENSCFSSISIKIRPKLWNVKLSCTQTYLTKCLHINTGFISIESCF